MTRQLFVFWQFNGNNQSYCQLHCPECYGRNTRTYRHYWNGKIGEWEKAFERLNRDIYFVFSYGEALLSRGFYECVDMIGRHLNWTLCIVTNFMAHPERLLQTRLAREKRLFLIACWHPEGVGNPEEDWKTFTNHLLLAKAAGVPLHVMMVWFPPVIKRFPEYFEWLDRHDIRVGVRRYAPPVHPKVQRVLRSILPRYFSGKIKLANYSPAEHGYLYAYTCPKVTEYGLNMKSTYGKLCSAGKDMILVEYDGAVALCADCYGFGHRLGNIFNPTYKLNDFLVKCPTNACGGDYGMLHFADERFGSLPEKLWRDTFISQVEDVRQGSSVPYHRREEMLYWIKKLKEERK